MGDSPGQLLLEPCPDPKRNLKTYSLVWPLLVSALLPVVLLLEFLAPQLIHNLLDLPSSLLDLQVCPGESLSGEKQGTLSMPGAPRPSPPPPGWVPGSVPSRRRLGRNTLLEQGTWDMRTLVHDEV